MIRSTVLFVLAFVIWLPAFAQGATFEVVENDEGVTVKLDGALLTRYLVDSGGKPILWPIIGPTGKEMTRAYPMRKGNPDEKVDHQHHRSFWYTHGDVNGIDFWAESKNSGTIVHRRFDQVQGGDKALITTRNDWIGPDGKIQCEDERKLSFGASGEARWIDFDITIKATQGKVTFGDTKEGTFGIRMPGTMRVEVKRGGKIINSEGDIDVDAWGNQAAWVDYHGPVDGATLGIAILNHPSSFRFPTYWHVRVYGLFAANPFGLHNFKNSNDVDGSHTLESGESFSQHYRVLFHKGDEKTGKIAEAFSRYAKLKKGAR